MWERGRERELSTRLLLFEERNIFSSLCHQTWCLLQSRGPVNVWGMNEWKTFHGKWSDTLAFQMGASLHFWFLYANARPPNICLLTWPRRSGVIEHSNTLWALLSLILGGCPGPALPAQFRDSVSGPIWILQSYSFQQAPSGTEETFWLPSSMSLLKFSNFLGKELRRRLCIGASWRSQHYLCPKWPKFFSSQE